MPAYELRCELRGHEEDVRGVLVCDLGVVTASRDKTIKIWVQDGPGFSCMATLVGHTDYVSTLAYIPPGLSQDYPSGALVSGSRDTTVMVWDPITAAPIAKLQGHKWQVSAVRATPTGGIVSASLDKTICVWSGGRCVATLEGHDAPVLCLAVLPDGDLLSGSGDATIKHWSGNHCVRTFKGHTDTVRSVAVLPGVGFVSASHDFTAKVWTLGGDIVAELLGHTALIYAVDALPNGLIASGSEDNTCRVWNSAGQCLQVIEHVSCVWDVAFGADGDLVTASGDAVAYVWTAEAERKASPDAQAAYAATLQNVKEQRSAAAAGAEGGQQQQQQQEQALPPGVKVEEPHTLNIPGAKDGQYKFVREQGGAVNAYTWSMQDWKWDLIGEVSGPPSGGGGGGGGGGEAGAIKKLHKGKEYDYVIDVDVADGAPPLKLALNRDDNPYLVADAFMAEHDLPTTYKDQIVQFIMDNTSLSQPGPSLADIPITGGAFDPFTGSTASPPKPAFLHAPQSLYLVFDNVPPVDKLAAKMREFSAALQADPGTTGLALTAEESGQLEPLLQAASAQAIQGAQNAQAAKGGGSGAAAGPLEPLLHLLQSKLLRWPPAQLFPVLDIVRMLVLREDAQHLLLSPCSIQAGSSESGTHQVLGSFSTDVAGTVANAIKVASAPSAPPAAQQLACRAAANAFKQPQLRLWLVQERCGLLDTQAEAASSSNKAVRTSYATLLSNYVVAARQLRGELAQDEAKLQLLSGLMEVLGHCPTDDLDTLFRSLVATATLLIGDRALAELAKELGVQDMLRRVNASPEAKTPQGRRVLEAALDVAAAMEGKQ